MKIRILFIVIILFLNLLACSSKPPQCSEADTISLIRQNIVQNLGSDHPASKMSSKDLENKLTIQNSRASNYNETIKKYSCQCTLIIPREDGTQYKVDIEYESQLDDKNKHIVIIKEIPLIQQLLLDAALRQ